MEITTIIYLIIICFAFSVSGQIIRLIVELKKTNDTLYGDKLKGIQSEDQTVINELNKRIKTAHCGLVIDQSIVNTYKDGIKQYYDSPVNKDQIWKNVGIALIVGAVIGFVALIYKSSQGSVTIDLAFIAAIMTTGYAGSDFLEGIIDIGGILWERRRENLKKPPDESKKLEISENNLQAPNQTPDP
jgi:hypothetical protein